MVTSDSVMALESMELVSIPHCAINSSLDVAHSAQEFRSAQPFRHIVIDGFLRGDVAESLEAAFPPPTSECWNRYHNPFERKLACNSLDRLPDAVVDALGYFNSEAFRGVLGGIVGIDDLLPDPSYFGGGLHCIETGGKLDVHVDHSLHPKLGLERRINLIVYLNRDWKEEWGGCLEFWDGESGKPTQRRRSIVPQYNRAVVFETHDRSFHGHPDPLRCPTERLRKSMAVYYFSEPRSSASARKRAQFFPRPGDPSDPELDKLRQQRMNDATAEFVHRTASNTKIDGK